MDYTDYTDILIYINLEYSFFYINPEDTAPLNGISLRVIRVIRA